MLSFAVKENIGKTATRYRECLCTLTTFLVPSGKVPIIPLLGGRADQS